MVSTLFSELKRRRVFRVGISYLIAAWVIVQVVDATFDPLHIPDRIQTLVVALAVAGFPLALILAWIYQFTPAGLMRDRPFGAAEPASALPEPVPRALPAASIAVLPFSDGRLRPCSSVRPTLAPPTTARRCCCRRSIWNSATPTGPCSGPGAAWLRRRLIWFSTPTTYPPCTCLRVPIFPLMRPSAATP